MVGHPRQPLVHIAQVGKRVFAAAPRAGRPCLLRPTRASVNTARPNEIGPGVYDIHSSRAPTIEERKTFMAKAAQVLPVENLWVNPDCGLKIRG